MTTQELNTIHTLLPHGEAVRAGRAAKARVGIPTGPVPLGYRKVRRNGIVEVEIDEKVASLVREAFRLAALKRQPLRKIAESLTAEGLRSQRGIPLSATALWRVLTNPFYCGTLTYNGESRIGAYKPLISDNTFKKAQACLIERRRH